MFKVELGQGTIDFSPCSKGGAGMDSDDLVHRAELVVHLEGARAVIDRFGQDDDAVRYMRSLEERLKVCCHANISGLFSMDNVLDEIERILEFRENRLSERLRDHLGALRAQVERQIGELSQKESSGW